MENNALIAFLVEKVTKGVRKQIKGYVVRIKNDIEISVRQNQYLSNDIRAHKGDLEKLNLLFNTDLFLLEKKHQRRLFQDMERLHDDVSNILMDIKLLKKEIDEKISRISLKEKNIP